MTTEDFYQFDICPRKRAWGERYQPFRVSLNFALNAALHAALAANSPIVASDTIMGFAANPGIDIASDNLYSAVTHHSRLAELLATYVLSVGPSTTPAPISTAWGEFQPRSFLLPDGRLRRIVLVDRWTPEREQAERFSWRTAADTAITNRPMLITALIIGGARGGFRPSPWTVGFQHPTNGGIRVQKRDGQFGDTWKRVYREHTALRALDWLRIMQSDGAFEERVVSIVEDVPPNRADVLDQLAAMAEEIHSGSLRQTRSACYKFTPCPFFPACSSARSPAQLGWTEKPSPSQPQMVSLP